MKLMKRFWKLKRNVIVNWDPCFPCIHQGGHICFYLPACRHETFAAQHEAAACRPISPFSLITWLKLCLEDSICLVECDNIHADTNDVSMLDCNGILLVLKYSVRRLRPRNFGWSGNILLCFSGVCSARPRLGTNRSGHAISYKVKKGTADLIELRSLRQGTNVASTHVHKNICFEVFQYIC